MKQKMKPSGRMLLIAGTVTALACFSGASAQTTSYDANTVPINGTNNCGVGVGVLSLTTTGSQNAGLGTYALINNTTGAHNVAAGYQALYANTTGYDNVGIGHTALKNSTGDYNVAVGTGTLSLSTTGRENVAMGFAAVSAQSAGSATASYNVGIGAYALSFNLTGSSNTAAGHSALYSNTSGYENVANGKQALYSNTTGAYNTVTGGKALYSITSGNRSCAYGYQALTASTGSNNTAIGFRSLYANTTGIENTACGMGALISNTTGNNNSGLGIYADVGAGNLSNATAIGYLSVANASNKVRLGNTSVSVIEGQVAYSYPSDGRFKTNIKEEDVKGLEFIKKLRPVVYNFDTRKFTEFQTKNMSDEVRQLHMAQDFTASTKIRQSGFIAQEVEQAAKAVQYDFNGVHVPVNPEEENYSIAYSEFVVPLVKGMQEQQQMIEDQKKMIEKLEQQVSDLLNRQSTTTSLSETAVGGTSMEQNVPNPFSHETVIGFNLPQQVNNASLLVYDLSGKQLKSIPITQRGAASLTISADQLAAGMYIYSIVADGKLLSSKRMVVAEK